MGIVIVGPLKSGEYSVITDLEFQS